MDSQDQNMYFTNLLSGNSIVSLDDSPPLPPNPLSGNSIVSLDDSPPLPLNPTRGKKSIRGVNFIPEEDKLVVSAWLNCSLDAIQGTDQKHSQFWEKIFEYFHKYKETATERTVKSLSHRWSCIQKATSSFCSCLAQVEGLNQSGMTHQDKFEKAKILYQSLEKCNFQFEHCWNLLKDQPKWISRATKDVPKERKTVAPSPSPSPTTTPSPTRNVIENEVIELDRPMGRKAEKEKRKAQGRQAEDIIQIRKMKYTLLEESRVQEKEFYRLKAEKMEYDRKADQERLRLQAEKMEYDKNVEGEKLKLEAEKLRIEAEKMEFTKNESDQRIMMMDVSGMPEVQRLYFEELQREIIMRRNHA